MEILTLKSIVAVLLFGLLKSVTAANTEITVNSTFGNVIGLVNDAIKFGAQSVPGARFLGIPFAKPPIGDKRFQKPEPETRLPQDPYNATYFRPVCPQSTIGNDLISRLKTSEDCLHLNIFVPGNRISSNNKFPVMIWIYGGGFQNGLANIYYADILSAFNDVIVVTFNYRVGVLGFLDVGTGSQRNNGLHDQKLVIDWVQKHIESFGGDASSVTIFGESAGGASVTYQALYPGNRNKVHRAIAQSGSPLASWAFDGKSIDSSLAFANRLSCSRSSKDDIVSCLRAKPVEELINKLSFTDFFGPSLDGDFITMSPSALIENYTMDTSDALKTFADIDFLVGFNDKDGAQNIIDLWGPQLKDLGMDLDAGVPRPFFDSVYVPTVLNYTFGNRSSKALEMATIHQYIDWSHPDNMVNVRDAMVDLSTDSLFLVPAVQLAHKHGKLSTNASTYLYQFSHRPASLPPAWINGAMHTWDLGYMFGLSPVLLLLGGMTADQLKLIPEADGNLASIMMKYWTNFAKTGNTNNASLQEAGYPTWPQFDTKSANYIDLNTNLTSDSIQRHPAASRVNFWMKLVPLLTKQCSIKECPDCDERGTSFGSRVQLNWPVIAFLLFVYMWLKKQM